MPNSKVPLGYTSLQVASCDQSVLGCSCSGDAIASGTELFIFKLLMTHTIGL